MDWKSVDWKRIKAEYIAGGTSYRKLAAKYKVSRTALQRVAKEQRWVELKSQTKAKTDAKIVDSVSSSQASKATRISNVADKLLLRIERIAEVDGDLSPATIDMLASSLKKIKDVQMIKSDIDLREQEARIKALEEQSTKGDNNVQVDVVFGTEVGEWAK